MFAPLVEPVLHHIPLRGSSVIWWPWYDTLFSIFVLSWCSKVYSSCGSYRMFEGPLSLIGWGKLFLDWVKDSNSLLCVAFVTFDITPIPFLYFPHWVNMFWVRDSLKCMTLNSFLKDPTNIFGLGFITLMEALLKCVRYYR